MVHRLRDVMRRLRLGAPSLTDRGPGLDPNTVAEYLDNTLPSERVTDFEKVCLDSDIHLAEVGSCHQILTLVLGEPAEVEPASRQRMYDVQDMRGGTKPPPTPAVPPTSSAPATGPSLNLDLNLGDGDPADRKLHLRPTVPEYLREPRRRRAWVAIAAILAAACVIVVILKAAGQFEPGTAGGNFLERVGFVTAATNDIELAKKDNQEDNADSKKEAEEKGTPAPADAAKDNGKKTPDEPGVQPIAQSPTGDVPTPKPIVGPAPVADPGKKAPIAPETPKTDAGNISEPKVVTPDKVEPKAAAKPPVASTPPVDDTQKEKAPVPDLPPEPLGKFLSSDQVLLSDQPKDGWTRVAANQTLMPQHVLALPTYRAKVGLNVGVSLDIIGGTRVELLASTPQEMPGVRVLYGRVVLMPLGKAGTRLRVTFGEHSGAITFADADSIAAIEVRNLRAPGTNPEDSPPRVAADLFAASGTIVWEEAKHDKNAKPVELKPSQYLAFEAELTAKPAPAAAVPDWIAGSETIKYSDRRASPILAQELTTDRPARIGLLQLATLRPQKEVKSLALRCMTYVGQFRDLVVAINDPIHKSEWADFYIPELRAAVARDAETAAAVRLALEKQYPQQAAELYRMLLGYTDQQLAANSDETLVRGLDDELLAVRVLSYWNLKDITGKGEIYQPEANKARRQPSVRRWQQRLEAKEIHHQGAAASRAPGKRPSVPLREPVMPPEPGK